MLPLELVTRRLARRRARAVWRDPRRTVATLESFSRTETDGGRDLESVVDRVVNAELRQHLRKHADDELRHGDAFRRRAREIRRELGGTPDEAEAPSLLLGARSSRDDIDAHGFFLANRFDEFGEVAYVTMLHLAERKAEQVLLEAKAKAGCHQDDI